MIFLFLPHPRYLQKLCASFHISPNNQNEDSNFVKEVVKDIEGDKRIVALQIDEIYIKESLDYNNGCIFGVANNDTPQPAKTVLTFLVSSCFGNFKEVIRLVPVKQLNKSFLADMAKNVISQIVDSGLKLLCVI